MDTGAVDWNLGLNPSWGIHAEADSQFHYFSFDCPVKYEKNHLKE